jgi:hypothetical protein
VLRSCRRLRRIPGPHVGGRGVARAGCGADRASLLLADVGEVGEDGGQPPQLVLVESGEHARDRRPHGVPEPTAQLLVQRRGRRHLAPAVVCGRRDHGVAGCLEPPDAGPAWLEDLFGLAPAPKSQLVLFGGEHGLGGIAAYDAAETTDEDPTRVAVIQRLTWAYLRSALDPDDPAWLEAVDELVAAPSPLGRVESK